MRIVILEGETLTHEKIAEELRFPPYYGKNLDALCDCLAEISEKTVICTDAAGATTPFFAVIKDAARENKNIVTVITG